MRAPPESFRPITGAPARMARSMILQIFRALASERDPPNTVKSCAKTYTSRPSIRPKPVTNPSPAGRCSSIPKSTHPCLTNLSNSSNVPSSRSKSMRSRAESLPALFSRSRRSAPPPASASADWRRSSSMRLCFFSFALAAAFFSGKFSSWRGRLIFPKDPNREVRREPDRAKKQHHSEKQLGGNGCRALERRIQGRHIIGGLDEEEHRAESHPDDEQSGKDRS